MKFFSRSVAVAAAALLVLFGVAQATLDPPEPDPARALAERLHRAEVMLKDVPDANPKQIKAWIVEVTPMLSYEGLDPVGAISNIGTPQVNFYWENMQDGAEHNHVLGYTYCDGTVVLNKRLNSKVSPWTNRNMFLGTLVHEIIHNLDGAFCSTDSRQTESRTQLGTLEVLAAMANQGNLQALKALVGELGEIASNTYEYRMLKAGKKAEFIEWWVNTLNEGDPFAQARLNKSYRYWADDWGTLIGILDRYSAYVFEDFQDFEFKTSSDVYGKFTVQMDDLEYVLDHLEELCSVDHE